MISRDEVVWTYRVLFGREPESEEVVARQMQSDSFANFVLGGLMSPEFAARQFPTAPSPLDEAPPMRVDSLLPEAEQARMWARVQRWWQAHGDTEPYWTVLNEDRWRLAEMSKPETLDAFYATGRNDVSRMEAWFARNGLRADPDGVCAEFGCGVGRVTGWLAEKFRKVRAFDISRGHLEAARRRLEGQGARNVEFVHVREPGDLAALDGCDLFFSFIVLQHNPPPIIRSILDHAVRGLNLGGIAYFQAPTYMAGYSFVAADYEHSDKKDAGVEWHCLPQRDILDLVQRSGCFVREIQPDPWIGNQGRWLSHTILAERVQGHRDKGGTKRKRLMGFETPR